MRAQTLFSAFAMSFAMSAPATTKRATPPRRRPPVFIGDAMQPFDGATMLLALLRADRETAPEDRDQP